MSGVIIAGDTSGSVTLQAPAVAGATVINLPSGGGTYNMTAFAAGTVMLFVQSTAPTGWTKSTANDNATLRVVSGTAGTGGTVAFTTAFASQTPTGTVGVSGTVGNTTLVESQIPAHRHVIRGTDRPDSIGIQYGGNGSGNMNMTPLSNGANASTYTGQLYGWDTGGNGAHNHSFSGSGSFSGSAINLAVQYVDTIIATKD